MNEPVRAAFIGSYSLFPVKRKIRARFRFQPINSINVTKTRPQVNQITNESYNNSRPAPALCASCVSLLF